MNKLAIWLPTYHRPHTLQGVADNIRQTTKNSYTLYFGIEPSDHDSIRAAHKVEGAVVIINRYKMGYSNTIQSMYEDSKEPLWVHANDDFIFLPGWDEKPVAMLDDPKVMVVGIRQREDDPGMSAICMAKRAYIKEQSGVIDIPNRVFYPYHHNYIDTEFTETAQFRGVWVGCEDFIIDHKHPAFTGGPKDATYQKNDKTSQEDGYTFDKRRYLWQP